VPKLPKRLTAAEFWTTRDMLSRELALLHSAWDEYQYLFASGTERVKMLYACARWFFGTTQRLLVREVLLGISRLTDAPASGKQENLTIAALLRDPALRGQRNAQARLKRRIATAKRIAAPIRTHRHKAIAHLDHAVLVAKTADPLPRLPLATVTKALGALEAAYNEHGRSIYHTDSDFAIKSMSSAHALVRILEESERWKRFKVLTDQTPEY